MRLSKTMASCFGALKFPKGSKSQNPKVADDEMESSEVRLRMLSGSFYIPKKSWRNPRGEDAHFICAQAQAIGVADGVGSWADRGVDAGEYAQALMEGSAAAARRRGVGVDPKDAIEEAFETAKWVDEGSSTACVAALGGGVLRVAGVGDSGFAVFRGQAGVVARSEAQQHGFNCPYQLGNGEGYDQPECAAEWSVVVEEGDVVVLATDGVWDNVFVREIERVVQDGIKPGPAKPKKLAKGIAKLAYRNSMDENWVSPFSREASFAGEPRTGGKKDDITVVVGVIVSV